TGSVTDAADNNDSTTLSHVNIDETPPVITGAATTSPNANGWYSGDVVIHWTCTDSLSGIAAGQCPSDSIVSGEGNNLSATASTADRADNTASATVDHIKIDRTAPITTTIAPSGWQDANVTLNFTATDNLSGVGATYYRVGANAAQLG